MCLVYTLKNYSIEFYENLRDCFKDISGRSNTRLMVAYLGQIISLSQVH